MFHLYDFKNSKKCITIESEYLGYTGYKKDTKDKKLKNEQVIKQKKILKEIFNYLETELNN
jgi:hypothetical protein